MFAKSSKSRPVRLLMVTGSGRSGTSTVAGVLKRLGMHLPQPEKPAGPANPRGFYETQWVVDFHRSLLDPIPVRTGDSRPRATQLAAQAAARPRVARQLKAWLSGQLDHPLIVIKDPRAFWVHDLWHRVAEDLDVELMYLTMLRHPLEVAKSRDSAFLEGRTPEFRRLRETSNVAGWCNVTFESELATRSSSRCFLRYSDLVADWRSAIGGVAEQLHLEFDFDLSGDDTHEIDSFVDPALYRSHVEPHGLDLPDNLRSTAERVWNTIGGLVEDPEDPRAIEQLSVMRAEYGRMHDHAVAMAMDDITAQDAETRARVRRKLGRRHRRELRDLRTELNARSDPGAPDDSGESSRPTRAPGEIQMEASTHPESTIRSRSWVSIPRHGMLGRTLTGDQVPGRLNALTTRTKSAARRRLRPVDHQDPPRATQVQLFDGDTLWLALRATDQQGVLGLRSRSSGGVLLLDFAPSGAAAPGERAGWADLRHHAEVIARDSSGHELVVVDPDASRPPVPVAWAGPQLSSPTRTPPTSDQKWLFGITLDESIVVKARRVDSAPSVRTIRLENEQLVVAFAAESAPDSVVLARTDGERLTQLGVEPEGDLYVFRLGDGDVPAKVGEVALVNVESEGREQPLRRRHRDLEAPGASVVMPKLTGDPTLGLAALNVAYRPDGQLGVRRQGLPAGVSKPS